MSDSIATVAARLGLTVSAVFVPFSRSRNYKPNAKLSDRSLNWTVTIQHNGRDVLTTDYGAGIAHCPSYHYNAKPTLDYAAAIEAETETGKARTSAHRIKLLTPDTRDVLASLAMDAGAIDFASFEDWASDYGYDTDSRKAESVYRACLATALALRAALGDAGLSELRDAASEH